MQKSNGVTVNNREMVFEVKNFLESHLEPYFSIGSLAKEFGTNEFTKKGSLKVYSAKAFLITGITYDLIMRNNCSKMAIPYKSLRLN